MNTVVANLQWLYQEALKIWAIIYNYKYSFYILLAFIIIAAPFLFKIKHKLWGNLLGLIYGIAMILLVLMIINWFWNIGKKYETKHPKNPNPSLQETNTNIDQTTPEIYGIEPELDTNYQYDQQSTKQLFYSVSCSGCYANGCPSNGYYYEGYDSGSYSYYYFLCQSCSCTSVVGHSFWK